MWLSSLCEFLLKQPWQPSVSLKSLDIWSPSNPCRGDWSMTRALRGCKVLDAEGLSDNGWSCCNSTQSFRLVFRLSSQACESLRELSMMPMHRAVRFSGLSVYLPNLECPGLMEMPIFLIPLHYKIERHQIYPSRLWWFCIYRTWILLPVGHSDFSHSLHWPSGIGWHKPRIFYSPGWIFLTKFILWKQSYLLPRKKHLKSNEI